MASKLLFGCALAALAAACITRPVTSENPTTHETIVGQVREQTIDKVDLLFAIDNSASMGDKQDLLAAAVPALVNRLLDPNCVSTSIASCTVATDCVALAPNAQCDAAGNGGNGRCVVAGDGKGGTFQCSTFPDAKPEFQPVHDLHVGIVSSSLGGAGSPDVCVVSGDDATHQDDRGYLLSRTTTGSVADAQPVDGSGGGFLAWLPASDPKNAGRPQPNVTPSATAGTLVTDFQSLVEGVQQTGCGLEAQLESWYRFLVQPDPWNAIVTTNDASPPRTKYDGVDAELLKMRHDFLRPDSLVAIVQLTDEEDSWSDPLWDGDVNGGGYGWVARTQNFPNGPNDSTGVGPRGTHECDTNPMDPDCTSCAFGGTKPVAGTPIADDPSCTSCIGGTSCKPGWWTPATPATPIAAADGLNVRYGDQTMRRRYGFDNQHAIPRYVDGLRSTLVPDRAHESHDPAAYAPTRNCTNPLFAAKLPDGSDLGEGALCAMPFGSRTPDLVFYALIGGVPNELLPKSGDSIDWVKILGHDPAHGDLSGIDPHMIESTAPRAGLPAPSGAYDLGTDPSNGREWNTLTSSARIDLQYACTFDLPKPRPCAGDSCDCSGAAATAPDGPPLCDPASRTTQIKGKAYPTIRELRVAQSLGAQAVVASLCAKVVTGDTSDPSYGYNPAMQAIVDRLAQALAPTCLPNALKKSTDGSVPCSLLTVYPSQTDQAAGCTDPGMCNPASPTTCGCAANDDTCAAGYEGILARFRQQYLAALGDAGAGAAIPVVCVYQQLLPGAGYAGPTCADSANSGWCYIEGAENTGGCAQAIQYGGSGPPPGTTVDLECIE